MVTIENAPRFVMKRDVVDMAIMQRLECRAVQNPTNLDMDKDVVISNRVRRIRKWHARHTMECPVVRTLKFLGHQSLQKIMQEGEEEEGS